MKISKLWESLVKHQFNKIDDDFLNSFREPGNANNRLAAWDPFDKTMRYYKFMLFHQLQKKDENFFCNYARLGKTNIGNPIAIKAKSGQDINLDLFFSVEEFEFLDKELDFRKINHIVEIGAGFGRTAQAMLKLVTNIRKYTIVDLPEVLSLSSAYLKQVLNQNEFSKIDFIDATIFDENKNDLKELDLVINIDSFQEMTPDTVKEYFDKIIAKSKYFYSKNAVGKYRPEVVGIYGVDEDQLLDVFSLGLSRNVLDIFNEGELDIARAKHAEEYCPINFEPIKVEPLGIFPYYLNILYGAKKL
jgi:putative sugar O-methyltransferase